MTSHAGGGKTPVRQSTRVGAAAQGVSPKYVSQIGTAVDPKAVEPRRAPMPAGGAVPLGNAKALDVGRGGVGTGRTIHRSGSQGVHGQVNPGSSPPARDILASFGPENSRGGRKI
jgi:hypothetical protein